MLEERLAATLPEDYRFARRAGGGWTAIPDVGACDSIDDALLVPAERLDDTLARLRG